MNSLIKRLKLNELYYFQLCVNHYVNSQLGRSGGPIILITSVDGFILAMGMSVMCPFRQATSILPRESSMHSHKGSGHWPPNITFADEKGMPSTSPQFPPSHRRKLRVVTSITGIFLLSFVHIFSYLDCKAVCAFFHILSSCKFSTKTKLFFQKKNKKKSSLKSFFLFQIFFSTTNYFPYRSSTTITFFKKGKKYKANFF